MSLAKNTCLSSIDLVWGMLFFLGFLFLPINELLGNEERRSDHVGFSKSVVYDGMRLQLSFNDYLDLGFSHISVSSVDNPEQIPNRIKYLLWTGVASNDVGTKWSKEKTPYVGKELSEYKTRWKNRLSYYERKYDNPRDTSRFGIIILDIEARITDGKKMPARPGFSARNRSATERVSDYKRAMADLYSVPLIFAKEQYRNYQSWSSYGDVPVIRTWWDIPKRTWEEWTTSPNVLNYLTHTADNQKIRKTVFADNLDFYSVSAYYFYSPKYRLRNIVDQYLAYMLFQIEANQSWSDKPIFLYHTFRYQGGIERNTLIEEDMVRNSVLFAYLCGVDGMILYDDSKEPTNDPEYLHLFDTFTKTIAELSRFSDYFVGNDIQYFKPENPRDLFVKRKPIVRGIAKNGRLLLAAVNTFANEDEKTTIPVYYRGKLFYLDLIGKKATLKEFIL